MAQTKTADGTDDAVAATEDEAEAQADQQAQARSRLTPAPTSRRSARRDFARIGGHWREDGVEEIVPIGLLPRARRGHGLLQRDCSRRLPDVETTVHRVVAAEQSAAVEWRMEGTFDGEPFQGIDPTGKHVELRGLDLLEIEDGEIVSNTAYYDGMAFARQIGMMPPQDSGAGARHEERLQRAHEGAPHDRRADGRLMAVLVTLHDRAGLVDPRLGVRHQGVRRLPGAPCS